jgi:hypothetical protein
MIAALAIGIALFLVGTLAPALLLQYWIAATRRPTPSGPIVEQVPLFQPEEPLPSSTS